jgi:hypothetical protein
MVWGDISYDGSTDLYGIRNGSLTCIRYRDEILAPIVRLYAGAIGDDFILMDDNARPHRARIGNEYFQQETPRFICEKYRSNTTYTPVGMTPGKLKTAIRVACS